MKIIKYIFVLVVFLTISQLLLAQKTLELKEIGLNAAIELSKKEHKAIFYMAYASWCPHCNYMKINIFTDSTVASFYNKNYICVGQDMEKGDGIELKKTLEISSYPTFIFYDSTGTQIYRYAGELKADGFIAEGRNALYIHNQLPYLKNQFEKDVSNAKNCLEYIRALKKGGLTYSKAVKQYFVTQKENDLLSETNWSIIANGITEINSREFQYLLKHQKEYAAITSVERVERKIYAVVNTNLTNLVSFRDSINYPIVRNEIAAISLSRIDSILFAYDMLYYESLNNWPLFQQATMLNVEKYNWNNYFQLNKIAKIYLKNINDKNALNKAIFWVKHSIELYKQYDTYLLAAKLYIKLEDKKDAAEMALKARDLNIEYGFDHDDADKLLEEIQKN
ncbi:MAG: thioredoxin family protein [Bacteroidetes bacterium]|nr:thioredoxin family protein [Bacteroidota bacterium]